MPVAVAAIRTPERVSAIDASRGGLQSQFADIDAIHAKIPRRHACIQQGHGDGVRLFAGGAGETQHAKRALALVQANIEVQPVRGSALVTGPW